MEPHLCQDPLYQSILLPDHRAPDPWEDASCEGEDAEENDPDLHENPLQEAHWHEEEVLFYVKMEVVGYGVERLVADVAIVNIGRGWNQDDLCHL